MLLKNCEKCSKVYQSSHPCLCPDCVKQLEEDYTRVRNFVKENPKVAIEVAAEATGVAKERILEYLRQGRLETADFSGPSLMCQRCGKPIIQGEYCAICHSELSNTFKSNQSSKQTKPQRGGSYNTKTLVKRWRDK